MQIKKLPANKIKTNQLTKTASHYNGEVPNLQGALLVEQFKRETQVDAGRPTRRFSEEIGVKYTQIKVTIVY